ncbi:hypothetical protein K474DRAFT_1771467 [Panus rudis PR-1116 ss-1]|nr:hypothetical protein K474DRAFT_1771467 [Panus rudis PR-1116 ss-1]
MRYFSRTALRFIMPSPYEPHLNRVLRGISTVELVYTSHRQWPLPPPPLSHPASSSHIDADADTVTELNISVLDSSFNPPTLAHLALANISLSQAFPCQPASAVDASTLTSTNHFHAKLLLLSVRNADKSLKPGDATYEQRLDMMVRLAEEVRQDSSSSSSQPPEFGVSMSGNILEENNGSISSAARTANAEANIAVAIIDEPTFVGKSHVLLKFLTERLASFPSGPRSTISEGILGEPGVGSESQTSSSTTSPTLRAVVRPNLTFIVGIDTLERLFAPRYYGSPEDMHIRLQQFLGPWPDGDGSRVICARRITPGLEVTEDERERKVLAAAKDFVDRGRIAVVDIDEHVRSFSSSEVRRSIEHGDEKWRRMVAANIRDYVQQHELYSTRVTDPTVDSARTNN